MDRKILFWHIHECGQGDVTGLYTSAGILEIVLQVDKWPCFWK